MAQKILKGIYTALITPFDSDNRVNEKVICEIMDKNIAQGAKGFFIGGSSGECYLMSNEERKELFKIASKYKDKTELIAHIGCISTSEAIELAQYAKELGYHYIASVAPFYIKMPLSNVVGYFLDIVEAVDIPMIIYNFPNATGVKIDTNDEDVIKLLKDPRIVGVKHTNLDLYELERINNIDNSLLLFNGFDEVFLGGLAMGVDGAIGSTFNFLLPQFNNILELFKENKLDEARKIQNKVNRIIDALVEVGLIPGIKYALELEGIEVGYPRKPLNPLSDKQKEYLKKVIEEYI